MNADEIVESAHEIGVILTAESGSILARPKDATPPELAEAIRKHKPELLAHFRAREAARWCEANRIDADIAAELLRIEDDALRLGWPYERLWNPRFWPHDAGHPRGLASVLYPGDTIAEAGPAYITIVAQRRHLLRFPKGDG